MIPIFTSEGGSTHVSLSPTEWNVIRRIDESRTIENIAREMNTSSFDVSKTVFGLITSGLVELRESDPDGRLERLKKMTTQDLQTLARTVHTRAASLLANHGGSQEAEAAYKNTTQEIAAGNGPAGLLEQFKNVERTVLAALGPSQAQAFVESIQRLVSGS
jgi:DNA-binding MarR family transcriptional regulator